MSALSDFSAGSDDWAAAALRSFESSARSTPDLGSAEMYVCVSEAVMIKRAGWAVEPDSASLGVSSSAMRKVLTGQLRHPLRSLTRVR